MSCMRTIPAPMALVAAAMTFPMHPAHAESKATTESTMTITGVTEPAETLREGRFRFLDLDGDGFLTREEIDDDNGVLLSQFESLDWDDDGRLSEAEYVRIGRPQ